QVQVKREGAGCLRCLERANRYNDIADWAVCVDHACDASPALHSLAGGGQQIAGLVDLQCSATCIEQSSGIVTNNQESVTLNRRIEGTGARLDRALRKLTDRDWTSDAETNLRFP